MEIAALDAVECALLHENFAPLSGEIIFDRIEEIARGMGFEGNLQPLPSSTEKDVHVMAGEYRIMVSQNEQALAPEGFSQALMQPFVQSVFPEAQSIVANHTANSFVTIAKGQPGEEPRPESLITQWEEAQGMMEFAVKLASLINTHHPASLVHWCPSDFVVSPAYFQEVAGAEKFTALYVCPFAYAPDGEAVEGGVSGLVANGSQWLIGKLLMFQANDLPLDWMHSRIIGFIEQVQEQNSIPDNGAEFGMIDGEVIRVSHQNEPEAELQQIILTFESSPEVTAAQNEEEVAAVSEPEPATETPAEETPADAASSETPAEPVLEPHNETDHEPADTQMAEPGEAVMTSQPVQDAASAVQEPVEPEAPATAVAEPEEVAAVVETVEVSMSAEAQPEMQPEAAVEEQPEPTAETQPEPAAEVHSEPQAEQQSVDQGEASEPVEPQPEPNVVKNPVAASLKDLAEELRTGGVGNAALDTSINPAQQQSSQAPASPTAEASSQDMQNMSMNDIVASVSSGPDNGVELTDQTQSAAMKPDDALAVAQNEIPAGAPPVEMHDPEVESEFQEALKEEPADPNSPQQAPMPLVQQAMAEAALQAEQQGNQPQRGVSNLDNFRALAQRGNARVRMAEAAEDKKESFFQKAAGLFSRK